jgi:beta-glucosidase
MALTPSNSSIGISSLPEQQGHEVTIGQWPHDFVWGVSTSSYQIEGAAHEDGRGESVWDVYCRQPGTVANGDTGDVACDHYHRYGQDVALMRDLGIRAYRFSVAWPRVLPQGVGAVNGPGLAFYDRLVDSLLAANIEPWLCLYHWDLPQALENLGGWSNRDSVGWFAEYSALVARRYGDRVKRFATFNEPSIFALFGYGFGSAAPGVPRNYLRIIHHVNLAHGAAVDTMRALVPAILIGGIHNRQPCLPERDTPEDHAAAQLLDDHWNRSFPDPQHLGCYPPSLAQAMEPFQQEGDLARICRPMDWFGLNHYSPVYARADADSSLGFALGDAPSDLPRTAMGWPIQPQALRDELLKAHQRYRLPIYVTENGTATDDQLDAAGQVQDQQRIDYLQAHTQAMHEAMTAGADVRGYFVWSLLDNFEWTWGYSKRFGLVYVDFPTQRRIPKASAYWYSKLIRGN